MKKYTLIIIVSLLIGFALFFFLNKQDDGTTAHGDRYNLTLKEVRFDNGNEANNGTIIAVPNTLSFYAFELTPKALELPKED